MEKTYSNLKQFQSAAKTELINAFRPVLEELQAVESGDNKNAVPFVAEVDGKPLEIWIEVVFTAKNPSPRKNGQGSETPAFDPFVARQEWEEEQRVKEAEKLRKQAEKAATKKPKAKAKAKVVIEE